MKSIYLAGPFFDSDQVQRIEKIEQALDNNLTVGHVFSPRKIKLPEENHNQSLWATKIFKIDTDAIKKCDVVLAIIDFDSQYVDSGTAFEIGYAYSHNKPVVIFHSKKGIVNLMITGSLRAYLTKISEVKNYNFNNLKTIRYKGPLT
ncbi:nucleoside deoxyribosyltransferase [Philodulcilactobacillus myokoensis]|uniref:Nucleoside deoxyribosyltransferase n=1 Tax=Philodulcilactobacillus myokoensis TaxID=2929573 RepID=A0A9W6B2M0_9LACO|nr:nucleoside 2-deoxyribosyltransferase [Philodulcilactobacillus myokoensis]GLB46964.1 nucleoside deoxyribosyltransferase [Philodulcilactobacillus myokoensis]